MFTNRSVAVVAMVFGAFILAQPNPAMAADPGKVGFNPQPDPPAPGVDLGTAKPAEFNPAPEPDVDKAMGVMPSLGASKGIAFPGQNVGMEKSDEPEDEKSASKGIAFPGQNVGMEKSDEPEDERTAKMGIALPGAKMGFGPGGAASDAAAKGIGVGELRPGVALPGAKMGFGPIGAASNAAPTGVALPGATKGFNPQPDPPKALQGLQGAPAKMKY